MISTKSKKEIEETLLEECNRKAFLSVENIILVAMARDALSLIGANLQCKFQFSYRHPVDIIDDEICF